MREISMTPFRLMSPLLAAALLLALAACSKSPSTESAPTEAEGAEAPTESEAGIAPVKLDAAAIKAAGIVVQALQPASMSEQLRAPGEVLDNAYGTALITPSVEALVVRRHAKLGDEVRAGAPLVTLSSVEVANAQAELRIAEQEWRRVSALGREAVSGRRINEAQVALDRARATAQAYGLPGTAAGRSNGQFTLTAPHAGVSPRTPSSSARRLNRARRCSAWSMNRWSGSTPSCHRGSFHASHPARRRPSYSMANA